MTRVDPANFSEHELERKILRSFLLRNQQSCASNLKLCLNYGFTKDSFTGDFRPQLFQHIIDFYQEFGSAISKQTLWMELKKGFDSDDDKEHSKGLLNKILKAEYRSNERTFLFKELKRLERFRFLVEFNNITFSKLKDINEMNIKESPENMIKESIDELTKVLNVGQTRTKEGDLFKDESLLPDLEYQRNNPNQTKGINTGIEVLTKITNGWNPGELVIVCGRPGQGKSILLMNFALEAYLDNKNILFITLEMPFRQQQLRAISRMLNLPYSKLKVPHYLSPGEWDYLNDDIKRYLDKENFFFMVDSPEHCTASFIDNKITTIENVRGVKIDLLIVDPIYLMRAGNKVDNREKEDPVGMISGELKRLAMQFGIPVLVASQFNREGGKRHQTGKDPNTMDMSFSDRLGHNSDIILGITADYNDLAQLHIMKFRDGMGPKIYLTKEFNTMKFVYDPEKNDQAEINKYIQEVPIDAI